MKKVILLISCLSLPSYADINHQVDLGFTDLSGLDDAFLGVRYRYFSDDLTSVTGPYEIKAHLNQISNFAVGGFANDNLYYINADAIYYGQSGLVLSGGIQYINDSGRNWESDSSLITASIGNQINEKLQLGLTAFYNRIDETAVFYSGDKTTSVEWSYAPYIRWTSIANDRGWDLEAKQIMGRYRYIQGRGAYYLNQDWSVALVANIRETGNQSDNYELQTQYWFNEHLALKLGLGSSLESGDGLNSATLLFTGRW